LVGKKPALEKSHFCFDHVSRQYIPLLVSSLPLYSLITFGYTYPVYMIKTKVAFLEGGFLSSQSEQFNKYSKSSDWLEKIRPSKKIHFCFIHVNRLTVAYKNCQSIFKIL